MLVRVPTTITRDARADERFGCSEAVAEDAGTGDAVRRARGGSKGSFAERLGGVGREDGGELEEATTRARTRTRRWVGRGNVSERCFTRKDERVARGEDRGGEFRCRGREQQRNARERAAAAAAGAGRRRRETSERRGWTRRWRRRRSFRRSVRRSVITLDRCAGEVFGRGSGAVSASWSGEARRWTCDAKSGKLTSDLVIRATDHRITGVDAAASLLATSHADGTGGDLERERRLSRQRVQGTRGAVRKDLFSRHEQVVPPPRVSTRRGDCGTSRPETSCQEGPSKEVRRRVSPRRISRRVRRSRRRRSRWIYATVSL